MQEVGQPVSRRLRRDSWLVARTTPSELRIAQRLARRSGMSLSEFVRRRVLADDDLVEQREQSEERP